MIIACLEVRRPPDRHWLRGTGNGGRTHHLDAAGGRPDDSYINQPALWGDVLHPTLGPLLHVIGGQDQLPGHGVDHELDVMRPWTSSSMADAPTLSRGHDAGLAACLTPTRRETATVPAMRILIRHGTARRLGLHKPKPPAILDTELSRSLQAFRRIAERMTTPIGVSRTTYRVLNATRITREFLTLRAASAIRHRGVPASVASFRKRRKMGGGQTTSVSKR